MLDEHTARIRALNDQLRQCQISGRMQITAGVMALGGDAAAAALEAVAAYDNFSPENDPYGEHDFGSFQVGLAQVFFKIDYFDTSFGGGALDPSDETTCRRVLTIMLAEEY